MQRLPLAPHACPRTVAWHHHHRSTTTPRAPPAAALPSDGPPSGASDAVAARIAAARRYKEMSKAGGPPPSIPPTSAPPQPPTDAPQTLPKRAPVDYAAMAEFLQSPKGSTTATAPPASPPLSPPQAPPTSPPSPSDLSIRGIVPPSSPPATASSSRPAPPAASTPPPPPPTNSVPFLKREADPNLPAEEIVRMVMSAPQSPGKGSAYEPAAALAGVLLGTDEETLDPNMRMEEFTAAKEQLVKRRGAEIITVDQSYNPGVSFVADAVAAPAGQATTADPTSPASSADAAAAAAAAAPAPPTTYQPKVSTWGAFPRPANISEAYGGGRDIRPGQELETKEQQRAREAQYTEALKAYREKMGLDIDPDLEAEAQAHYDAGMKLFDQGDIRASYDCFDAACNTVPLRSRVGGLATLQKAIVLDSLGYSDEAKVLYKRLRGHAVASVARKAKQLVFGFEAATFLKADQISYAAKKSDYARYFRGFADRNKIYIATEEDRKMDEELGKLSSAIAVAVLVTPLALFAYLAAQHHA